MDITYADLWDDPPAKDTAALEAYAQARGWPIRPTHYADVDSWWVIVDRTRDPSVGAWSEGRGRTYDQALRFALQAAAAVGTTPPFPVAGHIARGEAPPNPLAAEFDAIADEIDVRARIKRGMYFEHQALSDLSARLRAVAAKLKG